MAISMTLQYDTLTVDDYAAAGRALDFPGRWPEASCTTTVPSSTASFACTRCGIS